MIQSIQQGLLAKGVTVSIAKLCAWLGVPCRTVHDKPTKAAPKVDPRCAAPIKAMIAQEPSFGDRTAWPGCSASTRTRCRGSSSSRAGRCAGAPSGCGHRIAAAPSVATAPHARWSPDLARVWAGKDGRASLALGTDCHTRARPGGPLSRSGKATTASAALEHALISRFGTPGRVVREFLLRGVPAEGGQRPGLHQPPLHGPGPQPWPEAEVHHAALPAAERQGRARHPDTQGAMRSPPSLREPPA